VSDRQLPVIGIIGGIMLLLLAAGAMAGLLYRLHVLKTENKLKESRLCIYWLFCELNVIDCLVQLVLYCIYTFI